MTFGRETLGFGRGNVTILAGGHDFWQGDIRFWQRGRDDFDRGA